MILLLDTHFWIWWLTPRSPLKPAERNALDAAAEAGSVYLAAISLWEAQLLHSKERLQLPLPFSEWLTRATESRVLTVLPLDRDVVIEVDSLPAQFHGDPVDQLISHRSAGPRRSAPWNGSTHPGYSRARALTSSNCLSSSCVSVSSIAARLSLS